MSEAPQRIWAFAPDIFDNCSLWQDMPSPAGDTIEYIRADHVDALLKAEREKALREAADTVQLGDTVQNIQRRILALIENPAG